MQKSEIPPSRKWLSKCEMPPQVFKFWNAPFKIQKHCPKSRSQNLKCLLEVLFQYLKCPTHKAGSVTKEGDVLQNCILPNLWWGDIYSHATQWNFFEQIYYTAGQKLRIIFVENLKNEMPLYDICFVNHTMEQFAKHTLKWFIKKAWLTKSRCWDTY